MRISVRSVGGRPSSGCTWVKLSATSARSHAVSLISPSMVGLSAVRVADSVFGPAAVSAAQIFDAATQTVRPEDVREAFACGPDAAKHLQAAQPYIDAGFDHLVMQNVGPDPDAFLEFFANDLRDGLKSLAA